MDFHLQTEHVWWAALFTALAVAVSLASFLGLSGRRPSPAGAAARKMLASDSILKRDQRSDVLLLAAVDGSSVLCDRCGDLVKRGRWDAHASLWCRALDLDGGGDLSGTEPAKAALPRATGAGAREPVAGGDGLQSLPPGERALPHDFGWEGQCDVD